MIMPVIEYEVKVKKEKMSHETNVDISVDEPYEDVITKNVMRSVSDADLKEADKALILKEEAGKSYLRDSATWIQTASDLENRELGADELVEVAIREGPRQRVHYFLTHPDLMKVKAKTDTQVRVIDYLVGKAINVLGFERARALGYRVFSK
jgi:hypothetical protein